MGQTKDIGDAIVTFLNDPAQQAGFNTEFVASRKNLPLQRLEDLGTGLYVIVFPGPRNVSPVTRKSVGKNYAFFVAVVIRRPSENIPLEDVQIELAEQIENALWSTDALAMGPGRRLENSEITIPPFVPEELELNGVFVSFVPVSYYSQVDV